MLIELMIVTVIRVVFVTAAVFRRHVSVTGDDGIFGI
jgi:hypothetical protein